MPCCFFGASGSVRTRLKIQSAYWPSVVQVFWPLMTQSSPSLTALVRQRGQVGAGVRARRSPGTTRCRGWRSSAGTSSSCSCEPKLAITGPIMLALNASGGGTQASCISSCQMWRCSGVQSWPPHSTGQFGTAMPGLVHDLLGLDDPAPCRRGGRRRSVSRSSWGILVVKKVRISSRNAVSSSVRASCIGAPVGLGAGVAGSHVTAQYGERDERPSTAADGLRRRAPSRCRRRSSRAWWSSRSA